MGSHVQSLIPGALNLSVAKQCHEKHLHTVCPDIVSGKITPGLWPRCQFQSNIFNATTGTFTSNVSMFIHSQATKPYCLLRKKRKDFLKKFPWLTCVLTGDGATSL